MASRTLFTRATALLRASAAATNQPVQTGSIISISITRSTPPLMSVSTRAYHPTASLQTAKDFESDRTTLRPASSEGTVSASDDDVAHLDKTAFDPNKTRPKEETESAGKESNGNPLETSGANRKFSKPQGDNPTEGDMSKGEKTTAGGDKEKKKKKSGGPAAGSKKGGTTNYHGSKE
ncbi:hypothetical protein GE21DRAFT_8643 [Neurospora crassa]|uniref:Uncharacterized protein n=1 Tax=Neurospora crassa (strain ATCC 24698 / 74-OR23-1A / CBS 708.71 / DSM 1257 / FGSC 987) TaxID=367110 RepID=Q7S5V6_NEUCR|nr:hypothetical protein NCU07061 [Neurospora crassa OR74A]EAA30914.2 hypothetical protein NCU07061 [Neurospora crassa OR74A]KHE86870.1 hypothetical protein GE21DRAFT_8643 [Neurospora crassa]|eukprot:XP_960150.2 hypothetical protein NCU07061 [Neurospora crassa OR74A]